MLVKMEAYLDGEFWCARGIGEDIFTQGENLDELMGNVREAVALHCDESLQRGVRRLGNSSVATNTWGTLPVGGPGVVPLEEYLEGPTSVYYYCYDANARISE